MPLEFIHTNKIADLHTHTHMYAQIEQKVSSTSIICLISLRKCSLTQLFVVREMMHMLDAQDIFLKIRESKTNLLLPPQLLFNTAFPHS